MGGMKKRQQGNGVVGWLFNLLIIGLLFSFAVKLVPHYLDDRVVQGVVSSLSERVGSDTATVAEVRAWVEQGLQQSKIRLDDDAITVGRDYGVVAVVINYERRIKFFYNVDLVLTFGHNWKAGTQ